VGGLTPVKRLVLGGLLRLANAVKTSPIMLDHVVSEPQNAVPHRTNRGGKLRPGDRGVSPCCPTSRKRKRDDPTHTRSMAFFFATQKPMMKQPVIWAHTSEKTAVEANPPIHWRPNRARTAQMVPKMRNE